MQALQLRCTMSFLCTCEGIVVHVQAQCILFRRYPEVLAPFKYGGYPLLLNAVTLPEDSEETNASHFLGTEKAPLLEVWPPSLPFSAHCGLWAAVIASLWHCKAPCIPAACRVTPSRATQPTLRQATHSVTGKCGSLYCPRLSTRRLLGSACTR